MSEARERFTARLGADWRTAVALAATLALAFAGMHTVLEGWGWWWWTLALTGVSIGVGLVARAVGLGSMLAAARVPARALRDRRRALRGAYGAAGFRSDGGIVRPVPAPRSRQRLLDHVADGAGAGR